MRTYPRNSPEAAARILALVLVADGHVCRSEFDVLNRLEAERELRLPPGELPQIVRALCEDLLLASDASGALLAGLDAAALGGLLAEVDDPALQRQVLDLAVAVAAADRHLADGESVVLEAARRHWPRAGGAAVGARTEQGLPA